MNRQLFNSMKNDLGIIPYNDESDFSLLIRTLYSACAKWMRFFVIDQDENGKPYPKSKHYILNRGKETISHLIEAFPEIRGWFVSEDEEWPYMGFIREMRELMITGGEILPDDTGRLMLPEYTLRPITENTFRIYGMPKEVENGNKKETYVGITRIREDISSKDPLFLRVDSITFAKNVFSAAVYGPCSEMDRFEFFNPYSRSALYQSWENKPGKNARFALGRTQIINGMHEYYLFRKSEGGQWENARFPDYYKEHGEHRRVMLAQRFESGNPMNALYKDCGNVCLLRLYCRIPLQQEIQIRLYGWPVNTYGDMFNYIIPKQVWPIVEDICRELYIKLQTMR